MPLICHLEYLDKDGNKSADYYGNLHLGEEAALNIYLRKNLNLVTTKFQSKVYSREELINMAGEIIPPSKDLKDGEERYYTKVTPDGSTQKRKAVTGILSTVYNDFKEEEQAYNYVVARKASKILYEMDALTAEKFGYSASELNSFKKNYELRSYSAINNLDAKIKLWELAEDYYKNHTSDLEKDKDKIKNLWQSTNLIGSDLHAIQDNFFKLVAEANIQNNTDWDTVIENAATSIKSKYTDYADVKNYLKSLKVKIFDEGPLKGKDVSKLIILPEYKIFSEDHNLAGTLDLLIIEGDKAWIFDTKSKDTGKEFLFDFERFRMKEPLGKEYDNKQNQAALQMSAYKHMLEENGLSVQGLYIAYAEGDIVLATNHGSTKTKYNSPKIKNLIKVSPKTEAIRKLLNLSKEDSNQVYEPGKVNNANEILEFISGQDIDNIFSGQKLENAIANRLDNPKKDSYGREFFRNKLTNQNEYFKVGATREEKRQRLREYFAEQKKYEEDLANKFVNYANNQNLKAYSSNEIEATNAKNLLKLLPSNEYDFFKLKTVKGYEDFDPNIIVAQNIKTGEGIVLNINGFGVGIKKEYDKNRTNIFCNFISDKEFNKLATPGKKFLNYNLPNLQILRNGIIALDLQKRGIITGVKEVTSGIVNNSNRDKAPVTIGLNQLLEHFKILKTVLDDNNQTSKYVSELLTISRKAQKELKFEAIDKFLKYYEEGYTFQINKRKELVKPIIDGIIDFKKNPYLSDDNLMKSLKNAQNVLAQTLTDKYNNDKTAIALDPEYLLLSQMILQLKNANITAGDIAVKTSFDDKARTLSRVGNEVIKVLDNESKRNDYKVNKLLVDWDIEKKKVLKALIADKQKSRVDTILENDLSIFDNLWIVNPNKKLSQEEIERNAENLYKLKEATTSGLSKAEIDFINFFNKTVRLGFELNLDKEEYKGIEDGSTWQNNTVPLMQASAINKIGREEDIATRAKLMLKSLSKANKPTENKLEHINMLMNNDFLSQMGAGSIQNSITRREMLGINADGDVVDDMMDLETNLESIMQNFLLKGAVVKYHSDTMAVFNSLNAVLYAEEFANFHNTKSTRDLAEAFMKLRVLGTVDEEGDFAKGADKFQKGISGVSFAFSIKQMILELSTNTLSSLSTIVTQAMMGKQKRFNAANFAKASKYAISDGMTTHALVKSLGLYDGDPSSWSKKDKLETRKNGWYQSRWLFFLNNLPFKFFKTTTILAELDNKGILKTLSSDDDGNLIYDYKNDPRFSGIFDSKGELKDNISDEESIKKKLLWEAHLKDWSKDGTLDENGKPTVPITHNTLMSMQDYALSIYGSMDNDGKAILQNQMLGRMFLKFRSWFIAKKDNYWTKSDMSKVRGTYKWIEDPDLPDGGEFIFEYEHVEGILQTFMHVYGVTRDIVTDMRKGKGFDTTPYKNLSKNQKENLAKFASDMALVAIFMSLITAAMDDDDDLLASGYGKKVAKILQNSTGDLNMFKTSTDMVDSAPLATIGVIANTAKRLWTATTHLGEDPSELPGAVFKTFGVTKLFVD